MAQNEGTIIFRQPALVVLCGVSASGKSTFARQHFLDTQIVSSDTCRAVLSDDVGDQRVSGRAFELFHWLIGQRLELGRTTVADSTALTKKARFLLAKLADERNAQKILILFDADLNECLLRDVLRKHPVGSSVITNQSERFSKAIRDVPLESWDEIITINNHDNHMAQRIRLGSFDLRDEHGPFDFIGDLHGCTAELELLVRALGYRLDSKAVATHPDGRKLVFLGDLGDRGPDSLGAFQMVMRWVHAGQALYTPGNHCNKLMRYLQGRRVTQSNGIDTTIRQIEAQERVEPGFKANLEQFIASAPSYLWLDGGALVVAHGGIKEGMIGRDDRIVQTMCLYGDITGRSNRDGTPLRLDWAQGYRGKPAVVYGHTPTQTAEWRYNTINIDQGCVFGGHLTALRWPERETVHVAALETYDSNKSMRHAE